MIGFSDLSFVQLLDWFGWIPGAILFAAAALLLVLTFRSAQPVGTLTIVALLLALAAGGLLFFPQAPRIARAIVWLAFPPSPPAPSGNLSVATVSIQFPPAGESRTPIIAQLWYPAAEEKAATPNAAPIACSEFMVSGHLAQDQSLYHIILYAPGNWGGRTDSASTAAELASQGYVVLAIDDVDLDPQPQNPKNELTEPLDLDKFPSAEAYAKALRIGDFKAHRQAMRAMSALDFLQACANQDWRARVRFDNVGFLGFSFGGATAAEAGTFDKRVAAVVNLDGWLFGQTAYGALDKPYMIILTEQAVFPEEYELASPVPNKRFDADLTVRDMRQETRLANRPNGFGFRIFRSFHENLSDHIFKRGYFMKWLVADLYSIRAIRDAYLLAFFDTYVRDKPSPLLTEARSPFPGVEVLKGNKDWLGKAAKYANLSVGGSR